MSKKNKRMGGKYSGTHTSVIDAAGLTCDVGNKSKYVTKIFPGFIKAGLKTAKGPRRVKIFVVGSKVYLKVRDNASVQDLMFYTSDIEKALAELTDGLRKKGFNVVFAVKV
jgi:hypothetical protein